ncbi:MAG: hypothetical protein OHK0023_27800 [Anaerolineae bacterium]
MKHTKRRPASRLLAVLLGIAAALLILEVAIRVLYPSLPSGLQIALRFVRRTPFTDVRLAPLPIFREDSEFGMITEPDLRDVEQIGSTDVRYKVDTYSWWGGRTGFRTPPPSDGNVQAVAIGDSHTFCFTAYADCWVKLLSDKIGIPISNLGQIAVGAESHARRYEAFVSRPELKLVQPKLVIWQFYGNDFNDDYGLALLNGSNATPPDTDPFTGQNEQSVPWLTENSALYVLIRALSTSPRDQGQLFVDPYRAAKDGVEISFGRRYTVSANDMSRAINQEGERHTYAAIIRAKQIIEANGGKFVVILMPEKEMIYRNLIAPILEETIGSQTLEKIDEPRRRMLAFCAESNLTCLDLLPALTARADTGVQLLYPDDIHLNAEGNRAVAEIVAAFLRDQAVWP